MSQFCGYTLELHLNDSKNTKLKGIITKIVDRNLVVSNAEYLDGSNRKAKEVLINGNDIADLKVIELPPKKKRDKNDKKNKKEEQQQQESNKKMNKKKDKKTAEKQENEQSQNKAISLTPVSSNNQSRSNTPNPNKQHTKKEKSKLAQAQDPDQPYNYHANEIDWVGDSAHQVKHLEEFDFLSNLEKFDKASVFKELSESDRIDPYNRLVGHNKIAGKTKYDNNEMVIQKKNDGWDNMESNGSASSSSKPRIQSAAPLVSQEERSMSANSATVLQRRTTTPIIGGAVQLKSLEDGEAVATCSPLQLAEIDNLVGCKFGIKDEVLVENSGRGLAELIVNDVLGEFRVSNLNHNSPPLILLLVGNNISGARALSAGRHLFNHGIRVIAYLLHDFDKSEDEILPIVSNNLKIFNSIGGKTVTLLNELKSLLSKTGSPLEFILDGLQGYDTNLNDLIEPEVSNAMELVTWCNNSNLPIMSLDIPSGLDASSGSAEFESYLLSKYIVSVGLPLNSILSLYKFGYFNRHEIIHYLVDSGIPRKVFSSKSSLRKFDKQWFTSKWNIGLEVV